MRWQDHKLRLQPITMLIWDHSGPPENTFKIWDKNQPPEAKGITLYPSIIDAQEALPKWPMPHQKRMT